MNAQEIILLVLTVSVTLLALVAIAVLLAMLLAVRKLKKAVDEIQMLAHRGSSFADAMAPMSAVMFGGMRIARVLFFNKKRK